MHGMNAGFVAAVVARTRPGGRIGESFDPVRRVPDAGEAVRKRTGGKGVVAAPASSRS